MSTKSDYLVCFGSGDHWTRRFLKKNMAHVMVLAMQQDGRSYIRIDPQPHGVDVDVRLYNEQTLEIMRKAKDIRILRVRLHKNKSFFAKFSLMTCVGVVQYVLGVKFKYCFTPYQLYKRLLKHVNDPVINVTVMR